MNKLFEQIGISDVEIERILLNSEFDNNRWHFEHVSNQFTSKFYGIYRLIITDGLLPLAAVSGISLGSFKNSTVFDVTNYAGIKESLIEVMNNFSLLMFPPQDNEIEIKTIANLSEKVRSKDLIYSDCNNKCCIPITDCYLFSASNDVKLSLKISTGTGLKRMGNNTKNRSSNRKYVPIRTSYGLYKFITVINYDKNNIYHNIDKNLDCNIIKSILIDFILGKESKIEIQQNVLDIFDILYSRLSKYGKAINAIKEIYYKELSCDKSYKEIRDKFYIEENKALNNGRELSQSSIIRITKNNKEFEIFNDLFIRDNIEETSYYLSGIPRVSEISAEKIAKVLHEFV